MPTEPTGLNLLADNDLTAVEDDQNTAKLDRAAGDAVRHVRDRLQVPLLGDVLVARVAVELLDRIGLHLRQCRGRHLVLRLEVLELDLRGVADLGIARKLGLQGDADEAPRTEEDRVARLLQLAYEVRPVDEIGVPRAHQREVRHPVHDLLQPVHVRIIAYKNLILSWSLPIFDSLPICTSSSPPILTPSGVAPATARSSFRRRKTPIPLMKTHLPLYPSG